MKRSEILRRIGVTPPAASRLRVIVDTDAKNEVDDQFALVQALLSESFDIRGIVAAHFGAEKSAPEFDKNLHYVHNGLHRPIRVYKNIDPRFILEDLYAKLALFSEETKDDDLQKKFPCENITVTNCTMIHGHGGVVIGSEMSGGIKNVVISNCVFQNTDRGIRVKTRRNAAATT